MLATYLAVLRRRVGTVLLVAAVTAPLAFLALTAGDEVYESEAFMLLGTQGPTAEVLGDGVPFEEPERRIATELEILEGRSVLGRAAESLQGEGVAIDLRELSERIDAGPRGFATGLEVIGTGPTPEEAQLVTQAVVSAYLTERGEARRAELAALEADLEERLEAVTEELGQFGAADPGPVEASAAQAAQTRYAQLADWLEGVRVRQAGGAGGVQVVSAPSLPEDPATTLSPVLAGLLAVLGAVVLGVGVALVLDLARDAVRTREELDEVVDVPVIAEVPRLAAGDGNDGLLALQDPGHAASAAARALRLRLDGLAGGAIPGRVLVTGDTDDAADLLQIGAALAAACGRAGLRTLLVADPVGELDVPELDPSSPPPADSHDRGVAPPTRPTAMVGVWSIRSTSARRGTTDARGLLDAYEPHAALDALGATFDVVIVVQPPTSDVLEAVALAPLFETVLVVGALGRTRASRLRHLVSTLGRGSTPVAGVVLAVDGGRDGRRVGERPTVRRENVLSGRNA